MCGCLVGDQSFRQPAQQQFPVSVRPLQTLGASVPAVEVSSLMQDTENLDDRVAYEVDEPIWSEVQFTDLRVFNLGYHRSALGQLSEGFGGR